MTNKTLTKPQLVDECIRFYSLSKDANGLPVAGLVRKGYTLDKIRELVLEAVEKDELEVVFSETDGNPHIRRLPREAKKSFFQLINKCDLAQACLYPSERMIAQRIDLNKFSNSPYTLRLWSGGAQLQYIFFHLKVLMQYHSDPRYTLDFGPLGGSLYANHSGFSDSEKFGIQNMSVGYSENGERVLAIILRYLCDLNPSHQRIWREFERDDQCKVNEFSFGADYFGDFPDAATIYDALIEELSIINKICMAAYGKNMFLADFSNSVPSYYHVLLISTEREYRNFAHSLDQLISENLDKKFFQSFSKIAKKIEEDKLGSIGSLKLWLRTFREFQEGDPIQEATKGIDFVRKERSIGAHGDSNTYDIAFTKKQGELIGSAYESVRTIRLILQNLPSSKSVEIPEWLNGKIVNP